MNKNSLTKNYIYNLTYQVLIIILPLITTPYISRVLGAENIGIYSYTISITTYFIMFGSLGISMYAQREIAYLQDDKRKRSEIFFEIFILRLITMAISMIIFYCIFVNGGQYQVYYKILLIELVANCLDISWFFQGIEDFKKTVIKTSIVKILSIILIFILVKKSNDLFIYFIIYVVSNLLGNMSLWIYIPKFVDKISVMDLNILRHLKPTISLFIPQIAIQIYTLLDKVMLGAILADKAEVGYYEQAQKTIKILLTIVTSLGTIMIPRMANTFIKGNHLKLREYMNKAFNFVLFISIPMIFGVISISESFVPLFFGDGYDQVVIIINVISPILLIIGLSNVIGTQYLLPTKQQKKFTISVLCGAIINFTINLCCINTFGAVGASVSTVLAELSVTLIQFYFIRKELDFKQLIKTSKNYVILGVLMFIPCIAIKQVINAGFISIISQVIVGIIIYAGGLILIKDKFIIYVINKIKNILNKENETCKHT